MFINQEKTVLRYLVVFLIMASVQNVVWAGQGSDEEQVVAVYQSYARNWLLNDETSPAAVMSLFTDDAIIMPHHGDPMRKGRDALSEFWFPGGELFGTIDRFDQEIERVEVAGDLATVFGRFGLAFTMDGSQKSVEGNQLAVMRRTSDGWKIFAMIWNDPP
jgi:uncharacterized protein (TIGR02246 family)